MTYLMSFKTNRPYRSFWRFVFSFILVFGLLQGFLPKNALASNNYINNVSFFNDAVNGNIATLKFHCLTSFSFTPYWGDNNGIYHGCETSKQSQTPMIKLNGTKSSLDGGKIKDNGVFRTMSGYCGDTSFTAGHTYEIFLSPFVWTSGSSAPAPFYYDAQYRGQQSWFTTLTSADYISGIFCNSVRVWPADACLNETYYLVEYPTLIKTFPENNAEITGSFYVEGSFTQPTPAPYEYLSIYARIAGTQNLVREFNQRINFATSGEMSMWIYGLASGYYDFDLMMTNNIGGYYFADNWIITNIHIVDDLPITLPPFDNQPPIYAPTIYSPYSPAPFYLANNSYSTSTAFYNTLTGTFAPVLLSIGENLTNFSRNFTPSNASSTGNQLGNSILLVRGYITNINSFFANFPVGQFLLLYLIALVVVIVLRLVKGLISLFKL